MAAGPLDGIVTGFDAATRSMTKVGEVTRSVWDDAARRSFDGRFLLPLERIGREIVDQLSESGARLDRALRDLD